MFAQAFNVLGTVLALALRVGDDTVPGIKEVQTIQGGEIFTRAVLSAGARRWDS